MRRFRLTKAAKILIMLVVIVALAGGAFAALKTGFIKTGKDKDTAKVETSNEKNETSENNIVATSDDYDASDATINLSLDEWIG